MSGHTNTENLPSQKLLRTQFTEAFKQAVTAAADNFTAKWNNKNPSDPVQVRFTPQKLKIINNPRFRAQMVLTMEVKRNFQWQVMSRVTREFPSTHTMEKHSEEVEFELWMKMFDEITQIGFASVVSYISPPNGTQNDKQTVGTGNFQTIEEPGE